MGRGVLLPDWYRAGTVTWGARVRSPMATSRLRIIAEWLGFVGEWLGLVGLICFMLVAMILACVLYPLILCVQWAARWTSRKLPAIIELTKRLLWTRITLSTGR